jgi:hypothetical protein
VVIAGLACLCTVSGLSTTRCAIPAPGIPPAIRATTSRSRPLSAAARQGGSSIAAWSRTGKHPALRHFSAQI